MSILTASEAAAYLRTAESDAAMLALLPMVDEYLLGATGHDWAADAAIDPTAKLAAGTLLVNWYDNPNLVGNGDPAATTIAQLAAKALRWRKYLFCGRSGAGPILLDEARTGDVVITLMGVYGVSGDQKAAFEATVSEDGQIQQLSGADLSDNQYVVVLKHPADDVTA